MNIFGALALVTLGIVVSEVYNWRIREAGRRKQQTFQIGWQGAFSPPPGRVPPPLARPASKSAMADGLIPPFPVWMEDELKRRGRVAAKLEKGQWTLL